MSIILQKEEEILRNMASTVPLSDIGSKEIQHIITDMKKALAEQDDAVAIAAPQIGVSLRIFVVSGRALSIIKNEDDTDTTTETEKKDKKIYPDLVFINPKIVKASKDTALMDEGCLSVRYLYGKVKRAKKTSVTAHNEHGTQFTMGGSGLMSQIFQHEIDHLDGVLFIDKATQIEEILPKAQKINVEP